MIHCQKLHRGLFRVCVTPPKCFYALYRVILSASGTFYHIDVCRIKACTSCVSHMDAECTAGETRSSKYTITLSANHGDYSLYIAATQYENRDTWIMSSCGNCYTCTEYFKNETLTCFYSSSNIQRTLTTSYFKYVLLHLVILVIGSLLSVLVLSIWFAKNCREDTRQITNEAKYCRMISNV